MESGKKQLFQSTMESGIALGVFLVIMNIIVYRLNINSFNFSGNVIMWFVQVIGCLVFLWYYTKRFRDKNLNGFMNYNQAFTYGILLMFFSAIIVRRKLTIRVKTL